MKEKKNLLTTGKDRMKTHQMMCFQPRSHHLCTSLMRVIIVIVVLWLAVVVDMCRSW